MTGLNPIQFHAMLCDLANILLWPLGAATVMTLGFVLKFKENTVAFLGWMYILITGYIWCFYMLFN